MDKKTLLAIVLSVVVISMGFMLQTILFPVDSMEEPIPSPETARQTVEPSPEADQPQATDGQTQTVPAVSGQEVVADESDEVVEREVQVETDVFLATFSTRGGTIQSLKLKEHETVDGEPVEMIYSEDPEHATFDVIFGDHLGEPVDDLFAVRQVDTHAWEFSRDFLAPAVNGERVPFTLRKTYVFQPRDYLIELQVSIENSVNEYPALNFDGVAYTVMVGPQIGPEFEKLDARNEYRKYFYYANGKRRNAKVPKSGIKEIEERITWTAIAGKYFTLITIPDATMYNTMYSTLPDPTVPATSKLYMERPVLRSSRTTDVYRFYLGPKQPRVLDRYDNAESNGFGLQGLSLGEVVDRNIILGWLESILKFFLVTFYRVIPNYGVAILLLTLLIKAILYPLTHKSYESTSKMQALSPKMEALKEKYKDNSQKLNQEMAELYKKEGVNPLGGCLPMLFQIPVFIALYGLLNSHFDLRGATFIAGWINDLSSPESIWNFAPFRIPILGWSDLRLLPILFVGTQLLSARFMQQPSSASNKNTMLLTYGMPLFFFFILYDMPSGLLLYWTAMNLLTTLQQVYTTRIRQKKAKA
jgi:YidC/Oxa1 family membrane protein insertase